MRFQVDFDRYGFRRKEKRISEGREKQKNRSNLV